MMYMRAQDKMKKYVAGILLAILFTSAVNAEDTAFDSTSLYKPKMAAKLILPITIASITAGYMAMVFPGYGSVPNDIPMIDDPWGPSRFRFRHDIASYAFITYDQATILQRESNQLKQQNIMPQYLLQFGLPFKFALELKIDCLNSALGLKYRIIEAKDNALALTLSGTGGVIGYAGGGALVYSHAFELKKSYFLPSLGISIKTGDNQIVPPYQFQEDDSTTFRDNFSGFPLILSNDLFIDVPIGVLFTMEGYSIGFFASYRRILHTFDKEILNHGHFEEITNYEAGHQMTFGVQCSMFKYSIKERFESAP